jgi:SulP family sulfate permease
MLRPKLLTTLRHYSKQDFISDLIAGVVVGIVALPLAIAFGIASGVSPEKGLVTAIVAGFLISALGGSRVQIGGPTGAFVVIVYGIVHKYGIEGLTVATLMAGVLLMIMGFARLGTVIKFIPHPVVVGFTSGIAVIIFSSEVKDLLGLEIGSVPPEFVEKWRVILEHLPSFNPYALILGAATILILTYWPRLSRRIPGSFAALLACSAAAYYLKWPVETIGTRFGELPHTLPMPSLPPLSYDLFRQMLAPAFTIALLGGIESLLSAVVADGMMGGRHRSNMELVAQGVANIASAVFGGIPATGAIARTATNVKNGGKTPVSGIVHALTLLLILLFFAKWAKLIPLACLAGILAVVSYHMSEWRSFVSLLKGPKSDVLVLLATFLLTVLIDLTAAIEIGMVLSAFLFMHRMSTMTQFRILETEVEQERIDRKESDPKLKIPSGVEVYEINGPFFFGVAHDFEETLRVISKKPKVQVLRLRHVPFMDATGLHALKQFYDRCQKREVKLVLSGVQPQPLRVLQESGFYDSIGSENVLTDIQQALRRAQVMLENDLQSA